MLKYVLLIYRWGRPYAFNTSACLFVWLPSRSSGGRKETSWSLVLSSCILGFSTFLF